MERIKMKSMMVEVDVEYGEDYLPTPRHRIPRRRMVKAKLPVEVRRVAAAEAPVAIVQKNRGVARTHQKYRWWEERLWEPRCRLRDYWSIPSEKDRRVEPRELPRLTGNRWTSGCSSEAERRAQVHAFYANFLIVDRTLYRAVGEPRYVLMTFGLGNNHGGTALMLDNSYNPNISRKRYFRLDDMEAAVQEATRVAKARGDTKDLPIKPWAKFEVRIPEAVRLDPMREHGDGDAFINSLESIAESPLPNVVKPWMMMAKAFQRVGS